MTGNEYIRVGAKVLVVNTGDAGLAGLCANGEQVEVYDLCGATVKNPDCYVKIKTKAGNFYAAYIRGLGPLADEDAVQRFTTQLSEEEAAAELTKRKLAYLKATKRKAFDDDHFKAWEAVRIMGDTKATDTAKADQLASLIR